MRLPTRLRPKIIQEAEHVAMPANMADDRKMLSSKPIPNGQTSITLRTPSYLTKPKGRRHPVGTFRNQTGVESVEPEARARTVIHLVSRETVEHRDVKQQHQNHIRLFKDYSVSMWFACHNDIIGKPQQVL